MMMKKKRVKVMKTPCKKNAQMRMATCASWLWRNINEINSNSNYNEFQDVLQELYFDLEKLGFKKSLSEEKKNSCLENELNELKENFENIEKAKISFENENEALKKKNDWITSSLQKFSNGQNTFDMILANQKCIFDKNGLGYKPFKIKNILRIIL